MIRADPFTIFLAALISVLVVGGSALLVGGRSRRLTLDAFYREHPRRAFADVRLEMKLSSWQRWLMGSRLNRVGVRLANNRRLRGPINNIEALAETAGVPISGPLWLMQTAILVVFAAIGGAIIASVTQVPIFYLLPVGAGFFAYSRLSRQARQRRQRIQSQLPSVVFLMASAAEARTNLDGESGVMAWAIQRIDDDVTKLFRLLVSRASAHGVPLENTFEEAAERMNIPELMEMAKTFAVFHEGGRGLAPSLRDMAHAWQQEQGHLLEASMGTKSFLAIVPVVLLDLPALMIIIMTPAAMNVIGDLFH